MKTMTVVSLMSVGFATGCGAASQKVAESDVNIRNGEDVSESDSSALRLSTVALTRADLAEEGSSFCTGTLISKRVVLTAAHCLVDESKEPRPGEYMVSFGTQVGAESTLISVAQRVAHPEYDPAGTLNPIATSPSNDIGVLVLSEDAPAPFTPTPIFAGELSRGSDVALAGFGVTGNRNNNDTGTLRTTTSRITQVKERTLRLNVGTLLSGSGACAGDSGGPLYVASEESPTGWAVTGITSTGRELPLIGCFGSNQYVDARAYGEFLAPFGI